MSQKTVFISGGNRGIGRAIAERFLEEGYIVGAYSRSGRFDWGQDNPNLITGVMDSTDPDAAVRALEDFTSHTGGRLDVLVNNAGIAIIGAFDSHSYDEQFGVINTNVMGYINVIKAAQKYLAATPGAQIVNISSASSYVGTPDLAVYSAAKFGIRGLTEALDIEFMKYGIRVIDINPLFVKTDMVEDALKEQGAIPIFETLGLKLVPKDVADVVWKAIQPTRRNSRRVHYPVGKQAAVLSLQHFLPNSWPRAITRAMAKRQMKG